MKTQPIEQIMLALVNARGLGKSICPSEVARRLSPENWRSLMVDVRSVAASLQAAGKLRITQGGVEVDLNTVRGPVRLSL
jgi:hypothetical protein